MAPSTVTTSGFDAEQTGTVAGGSTTSFTFTAPAGLTVYFNAIDRSAGLDATFTDPDGYTLFSNNASDDQGPFVLTVPGTYTLTVSNPGGSANPYDFNMLSLPDAATPLSLGAVTSGTLSPGTSIAVYSFSGTAGQRLYLDNQQNSGDSVNLWVFDPYNNNIVAINSSTDAGPLTLAASGTLYLMVDGEAGAPIGYRFRLIDTSTSPLTFGAATNGTFAVASQADVYTFTGTAGEQTDFHGLSEPNGFSGASWQLFGPGNQPVTGSSWFGSDLSATLPAEGVYTLVVSNTWYYSPSSYSFEAFVNVDPTATLTLGQEVTGTIANPGDAATYTFTGSAGQELFFNGLGTDASISAVLTDPDGNTIFSTGAGSDAGPYTLSSSGTYTLTIGGNGSTGVYDFRLSDTATATPIATGSVVSGSIATGTAADLYVIDGAAGERIHFSALSNSGPYYDLTWSLYDPTDSQFIAGGNGYYSTIFQSFDATLPHAGDYVLLVGGTGNASGPITYGFEAFDTTTKAGTLTPGAAVTGTLANPGDVATYTFTGTAGQQVAFSLQAANGIVAVLTDPYGDAIFNTNNGPNEGPYTLDVAGTYTLTVSGDGDSTGGYGFVLFDTSELPVISTGTAVSDTLASGSSTNGYQLSGAAGEVVTLAVLSDSGPYYDISWSLYDATTSQSIPGNYGSYYYNGYFNDFQVTLPSTGTYILFVRGNSYVNGSITYGFEAYANTTTTDSLSLGTESSGTLTHPGDAAVYTFIGSPGQQIYFDGLTTASGIEAALTDPYGNALFNNFGGDDEGPFTLTTAGTYTLTFSSPDFSTGGYDFVLDDTSAAAPMPTGTVIDGTLSTGESTRLYQFSGTAGEVVLFAGLADSPSYGAVATLYNPYDGSVTSFDLENGARSRCRRRAPISWRWRATASRAVRSPTASRRSRTRSRPAR